MYFLKGYVVKRSPELKIGVNAMQVRAAKSGVGQYIHGLMEQILKIDKANFYQIFCNYENRSNYTYNDTNSQSVSWGLKDVPKSLRLAYENIIFPSEIQKNNIDLFWGPSNFLPPIKKTKYVATINDLSYYVHPERCPFIRRQYWYLLTSRTVKVADKIITISSNSANDIIKFFPEAKEKIEIISLAAHHRFQKLKLNREDSLLQRFEDRLKNRPYLLYVGTLEPGKNVLRLLAAFEEIAKEFPDYLLVLGGDKGWMYNGVLEKIEKSEFADRIHYLGHLSDDEIVHFFNFCTLFCFPSTYEGFGLPPLEAMSCGVPVLTSNNSSIPEVVGDAAYKVDPFSVEEIASGMRVLLCNEELREEYAAKGLIRSKEFSWTKSAELTLSVFNSL